LLPEGPRRDQGLHHRIGDHGILAGLYAREIVKLEAKGTNEDEEDAEEDARELRKIRERLDEQKQAIADLEKFYDDVKTQWGDIEFRNIGHVHYSPPTSVDV
jgi:Mg2+/Co2+ transporter CorC